MGAPAPDLPHPVVVCDVGGLEASAVTVDALARLQLTARGHGLSLRLRGASEELVELIGFMGLRDVLGGSKAILGSMEREVPRLRTAEPRDIARLTEIMVAAKAYNGHELERVRRWVGDGDFARTALAYGRAYVAEVDGTVAGWASVFLRGPIAWLEDLWVDPPYMQKGVGTALFRAAAAHAAARGAIRLEWEADADAVGFYERMGARRVRDSGTTERGRVLPIMALELAKSEPGLNG